MSLAERIVAARSADDADALLALVPFAQLLGFRLLRRDGDLLGHMSFADHLIGNANVDAIHGGALGALLELTGSATLLAMTEIVQVPKIVNISIDFLRGGTARETWARAEVIRHGRRVANVRVACWQEHESRPIAAANLHFLLTSPSATALSASGDSP
jgi:uncharacterized protein (TIGR00369 family)